MAKFEITSPDGKRFEVSAPDGASQEEVLAYAQQQFAQKTTPPENLGVAANAGNRAIAAVPDTLLNAPTNLWNLAKAGFGTAATALGKDEWAPEMTPTPDLARKAMEKMGYIDDRYNPQTAGQRMLAAGTGGAVSAAMNPASSGKQLASLLAAGATSGLAGQGTKEVTGSDTAALAASMLTPLAVNAAKTSAQNKIQQLQSDKLKNAPRDETLTRAMAEGYQVPPATVNPSKTNQVLESIAGKASTQQAVSTKNAAVTDKLARRSIGLGDDVPLTAEATQNVRREAYAKGYEPLKTAGPVSAGKLYRDELDKIESTYQGAARSFSGAVKNEVSEMIAPLRKRVFDAGDAVDMTKVLRENADKAFANGDKALGNAQRAAAKAIEDQLERGLAGKTNSPELLENFREARKLMAKTYTVEKAIKEGGGNVDANKIARELQKGAPLTGDLETIGRFANVFSKANQTPQVVGSQGVSKVAALSSALMGGGGAAALGPLGAGAAAIPFVVPPAAQSLILSKAYQGRQLPKYEANLLAKILADTPDLNLGPLLQQQQMAEQLKRGQ